MADERSDDKLGKMIDAARMYYESNLNQEEIAQKLGVSRPTISRFLQQARDEGYVQIKIVHPGESYDALAAGLESRFGLQKAVIAPVSSYENEVVKTYIGEAAAHYLYDTALDGDIIAVTWGTTLYQVARQLKHKPLRDVKVVQLNGGVSHSETNTYAHEVVHLFGKAFCTMPYFIPLPALVDHKVVKQTIEKDRHIRGILELGKQANIAVITVGAPSEDSVLIRADYFTEEEKGIIRSNAAGDICSRYIDKAGVICSEELDQRTIGISLEELKRKDRTVLVAGGMNKIAGIIGALNGGYANVLVTDHITARRLLEHGE
ncbi:sugar-binding transcriptional regulator [Paenibacillus pinisoli]|uniref:Sugar-binding transcriptional regulator n=1 Tax=Paenibacillus pinisoli TaxID=1276110 RepID=A0A3A6PR78_9BACL|nr:sugar-binding transcriptional regulator [Paenibacillus pinisoli]RJX39171.1 sugar-binding transcriptional regulator [Paenibacillus pinisoli]